MSKKNNTNRKNKGSKHWRGGQQHQKKQTKHSVEERSNAWDLAIASAGTMAATAREEDQLAVPIAHLKMLRAYIEQRRGGWNHAPKQMPPMMIKIDEEAGDAIFPPMTTTAVPSLLSTFNHNRFSVFEEEEASDSESSSDSHPNYQDEHLRLLGRHGIVGHAAAAAAAGAGGGRPFVAVVAVMTLRRLLIRVLTSLSELHAKMTHLRRRSKHQQHQHHHHRWKEGADEYALAFECLTAALSVTDQEYARLFWQQEEKDDEASRFATTTTTTTTQPDRKQRRYPLFMKQLAEDAQCVMIAVSHFSEERDKYWQVAERRRWHLQQRLAPQWEARDEVKRKLGKERWEKNPNAKMDYARQREADERELKALEQTMERLEAMDTRRAYSRSQVIYDRATNDDDGNGNRNGGVDRTSHNRNNSRQTKGNSNKSKRSNGRGRGRGGGFGRGRGKK